MSNTIKQISSLEKICVYEKFDCEKKQKALLLGEPFIE